MGKYVEGGKLKVTEQGNKNEEGIERRALMESKQDNRTNIRS